MVALVSPTHAVALLPARATPMPARHVTPREAWWRYVERGRSHELIARWVEPRHAFELTEMEPTRPAIKLAETVGCARPWEARVALWLLEARLSQLGEYWRSSAAAGGWARVAQPYGAPVADARPNDVLSAPRASCIHHYRNEIGDDELLIAIRGEQDAQYVVARAKLDVPGLDVERIDLLHSALPAVLARSAILREQIVLTQQGISKLVTRSDYEAAYGAGGHRHAEQLLECVLDRVRDGTQEEERPLAPGEQDPYEQFLEKLYDDRVLALHARFLRENEEDEILEEGPAAIRKLIAARREQVPHTQQHLITILEASLLARERMRSGRMTRADPEVRALNRLAYYL